MSESNRTLEDSSLQISGESRGEAPNFDILKKITLLPKPLDLSNRKDAVGSEPDTYSYNRNNPEGNNEEHEAESQADSVPVGDTRDFVDDAEQKFAAESIAIYNRKQYADQIKRNCPKCKITVEDAKIKSKQLCTQCDTPLDYQCARCGIEYNSYSSLMKHLYSCSSEISYNCSRCKYTTVNKFHFHSHMRKTHKAADESNANLVRKQHGDLIKRNCPKCKITVADAKVAVTLLCNKCETPLSYQCARCNKEYKNYAGLIYHLDAKCNPGNQNLKCPNCGYQSHLKRLMNNHLHRCLSGIFFSCGLCKYRTKLRNNLRSHVTAVHEDLLQFRCSECKTKPYKCEQCKTKVLICDTCRTGFSSNDGFQEHQKSCKQPVLTCKYCLYETNLDKDLKRHMLSKHLSASTSQN